ncbi:MAG: hydroxymethylbilane synthase [Deltaproteobacteria bacterium]|nr:hydroxymethylbilane synthase [Deltaproteobacteria bacterium]
MRIKHLRIGTRGSELALRQAELVRERLVRLHPGLAAELVTVKTKGDIILDVPLARVGGKGLFVKEIENALLDGRIDLAVHSMKDVPTSIPPGLVLGCVASREDPSDALVSRTGQRLNELPLGARIGTSSLRRQAQLLHFRPDFEVVPLRGNLQTRLRKMEEQGLHAIVLASVGLRRMGLDHMIAETIPTEICLPAIGQGVLSVETRAEDGTVNRAVSSLNDPETATAMKAERAFLRRLEGGCQVPIAAYAWPSRGGLEMEGMVASLDGKRLIRQRTWGREQEAEALGLDLAETILSMGGDRILSEIYDRSP